MMQHLTFALTRAADTTGVTGARQLTELGRRGLILKVGVRLSGEADEDEASEGRLLIADDPLADTTFDNRLLVYESGTTALTASATALSIDEADTPPAPYSVSDPGDLYAVFDVTAAGGGGDETVVYVSILAEVHD